MGYRTLIVVNLFALRATDPWELCAHPDPFGPENARWQAEAHPRHPPLYLKGDVEPQEWRS